MRFSVLGPLLVEGPDGPVAIPGRKERTLLALLVAEAGRPVPRAALVRGLWGEAPPRSAAKSLQAHVVRLRDALEPHRPRGDPGTLVITTDAGYLLSVPHDAVDALRFEHACEEARRAMRLGAAGTAAARLRDALGLWRGPAYGDFTAEVLQREAERLEGVRVAAVEDRVEAEIRAGLDTATTVDELERLTAAHPFRERLWGSLLLAHYRAGRQAEALDVFRRARKLLVDELGVEPGLELQELHARVLAQDPLLLPPTSRQAPLPAALDPIDPVFVGREEVMATVRGWWRAARDGGVAGLVVGGAGMGKTRVAAELAIHVRETGAALVHASAEPAGADAVAVLTRLARELDTPSHAATGPGASDGTVLATECVATLRRLSEGGPVLVVLDDLDACRVHALDAIGAVIDGLRDAPVLALLLCQPGSAAEHLSTVVSGRVELGPLGPEAAALVAALYVDESEAELATADVLRAGAASPAAVHEGCARWARARLKDKVAHASAVASAHRRDLDRAHAELAAGVADLRSLDATTWPDRQDHASDVEGVPPYKGLVRYEPTDAALFFGRERLVGELVARVAEHRLVLVAGASGSGKSSVVRAGLLPALASGVLPGSQGWEQRVLVPGRDAVAALWSALDGGGTAGGTGGGRLLVVDQLERLFTSGVPAEDVAIFLDAVAAFAERPSQRVVAVVRADLLDHVAAVARFRDLATGATLLVGPMDPEDVRRAVTLPARRYGVAVEEALATRLVAEIAVAPGALPLLSTAMLELWERRVGRMLTLVDLERSGGVRAAVARLAEAVHADLDDAARRASRELLLRMAGPGDEDAVVARPLPLADVAAAGPAAQRALDALVAGRLVTVGERTVELAHEALLREWPRLREWLVVDAQARELRQHLADAARTWRDRDRDASDLYRGARLAAVIEWTTERGDGGSPADVGLNDVEKEFVAASRAEADRETAEARARVEATSRVNRRLRAALAVALVVTLLAGVAGSVAFRQRARAEERAVAADAARLGSLALLADGVDRALLLAAAAVALEDSATTRGAVLATLARAPQALHVLRAPEGHRMLATAAARDGTVVATGSNHAELALWDAATGRPLVRRVLGTGPLFQLAASPADDLLAAIAWDGRPRVALLEATTAVERAVLEWPPGRGPVSLDFTADGRLVIHVDDGTLEVRTPGRWDVAATHQLAAAAPWPVSVDAGGTSVAVSGGDGLARLLDLVTGIERTVPAGGAVDLSPDGALLAVGAPDGDVVLHDTTTLGEVGRLERHDGVVQDLAFDADGHRLLSASDDGLAVAWDVPGRRVAEVFSGHTGRVQGLSVAPDGRTAHTAGLDGTAVSWDLTGARRLDAFGRARPDGVTAAAVAGQRLVTVGRDGRVTMGTFDVVERTVATGLRGAEAIAVSDDGTRVVVATLEGDLLVLDGAGKVIAGPVVVGVGVGSVTFDGSEHVLLGTERGVQRREVATGEQSGATIGDGVTLGVALSPDGSRLVVVELPGRVVVRSWPDGTIERTFDVADVDTFTVAVTRDGRHVVTGSVDGRVRRHELATGREVGSGLPVHRGFVLRVQAGSTDDVVASLGTDGGLAFVDAAEWAQMGTTLIGAPNQWTFGGRTDDGRVVAAFEDGTVRSWPADPAAWVARACGVAGRVLDPTEWEQLVPGRPPVPACGDAGTGRGGAAS